MDLGVAQVGLQSSDSLKLILFHKAAVAFDICAENRA